ncbi:MAG: NAD(P)/FAD-dependent oxidoreductase [Oscillospiraceae bacterium]|nr:NAD(P)/FAD-dependent oxidoreductase [Oscillospiraceae bacterium]
MKVIVIGGGAAGMFAGIMSAAGGASVTVFERNERLGRKLGITGKGRCNLTNDCTKEEFFNNIPTNPRFMYSSYSAYSKDDVMSFFEYECGVPLVTERGNRVFPESGKAADIVNALERKLKEYSVKVIHERVTELILEKSGSNIRCKGVRCGDREFPADKVIIATGGKSYPATGSTGDGYQLAKQAGHTITPIRPSLVPLEIRQKYCSELMGLSLRNVRLTLYQGTKKLYSEQGEMLFTHFGVSGPLVLTASGYIRNDDPHKLVIDLKPALDEKTLDSRIQRDLAEFSNRDLANSLDKLLPRSMIPVIVRLSGIPAEKKANQITHKERAALVKLLKNLELDVKGTRPVTEAIITSGGVDTKEIDPKTCRSKLCDGLYFAGEVIDVDAFTGGFNLQIAFSTAYAAAQLPGG